MDFRLYFKSRQGEMVQFLKKIVHLESPTSDKAAVDACSAFVRREFERGGARVAVHPQKDVGDLLVVDYPHAEEEGGRILVLTHIDTVWPVGKISRMPFYISGPKIFGPGVLDMKGGLTAAVFALATMRRLNMVPRRRVTVFVNSAEETGSKAADDLIVRMARKSSLVLCLEPSVPGGALKLQRKGRMVVRLETTGKEAHAGSPEKGVNAIDELAAQVARLKKVRGREMTLNTGLIGGGEKANVVAGSAWAVLDARFWTVRDKQRLLDALRDAPVFHRGARTRFTVQGTTPPMERTPAQGVLFREAQAIAEKIGLTLKPGKTGGGSDASLAAGVGTPALDGLGPDGDGIHAEHEHMLLPSLVDRTALLVELLTKL